MKRIMVVLFLAATLYLQGCLALVSGSLGYQEADSKYTKLYNSYKIEQENANIERQKLGVPAEPVKEYSDWIKEQPLSNNEIKVFKSFGVISDKDAAEIKALRKMEK